MERWEMEEDSLKANDATIVASNGTVTPSTRVVHVVTRVGLMAETGLNTATDVWK
jgi:membrane protein YdbS with pleckstrin-like domain